mmetsp:Transcript_61125/g.184793  ORF Transcript_61125/g.184793 Transcript_61125/m.184793 type:complete len:382 (+) Transcript_61125:39-1184(+)
MALEISSMLFGWLLALHEQGRKPQGADTPRAGTPQCRRHWRPPLLHLLCLATATGAVLGNLLILLWQQQFFGAAEPAAAPLRSRRLRGAQLLAAPGGLASGEAELEALATPEAGAFNADNLQGLQHLVLVAGHAVVLADTLDGIDKHDGSWYLEGYQRGQGLPGAFVNQIRLGVEAAARDPRALLVFSGGQTRSAAGPRDEGSSYYRVAEHYRWWGRAQPAGAAAGIPVSQRAVTEDFATDSFQNLLFSLCRFKEVVGHYPSRVTVVSFDFKRRRFEELHRSALRIPRARFSFLGSQPPAASSFDLARAERGEREHALRYFEVDPYGCRTPALVAKRDARNPFRRTMPYPLSCPEIRELFSWCGPGAFPDLLPWEAQHVEA